MGRLGVWRTRDHGGAARCLIGVLAGLALLAIAPGAALAAWSQPQFGAPTLIDNAAPYAVTVPVSGISCPSASRCIALVQGNLSASTNADAATGPTWTLPEGNGSTPTAIDCPTSALCLTINSGAITRSTDGGQTWASPIIARSSGTTLGAIGCTTDGEVCLATTQDGGVLRSIDGGAGWPVPAQPAQEVFNGDFGGQIAHVSCPTVALCVLANTDGRVSVSTDVTSLAPPTWTSPQSIDSSGHLTGVSCTPTACVAVAPDGQTYVSTDLQDPAPRWTAVPVSGSTLTGGSVLTGVSCTPAGACVAVGGTSTYVMPDLAAATPSWSEVDSGAGTGDTLNAVTCTPGGNCVIVDKLGGSWYAPAPATGHTISGWQPGGIIDARDPLVMLSCSSGGVCATGDQTGRMLVSGDGGTTWSAPAATTANQPVAASCVDAGDGTCVAVNGSGVVVRATRIHDPGAPTWTARTVPLGSGGPSVTSLSCIEDGVCILGTSNGNVVTSTDGGATWGPVVITPAISIVAVACLSGGQCLATSGSGGLLSTTNVTASQPAWSGVATPSGGLGRLTCDGVSFCVAVAGLDDVIVSTDASDPSPGWSAAQIAAPSTLSSLSCVSNALCVASVVGGQMVTGNDLATAGPVWTTVPGAPSVTAVSCTASGRCLGVDDVGRVVVSDSRNAAAAISQASIAFPDTFAGQTARATLRVTNSGGGPLHLTSAALGGGDSVGYQVQNDSCAGASVAPGAGCTLDVVFVPTEVGSYARAQLMLTFDSVDPVAVPLTGQGLQPRITSTPPATGTRPPAKTPTPAKVRVASVKTATKGRFSVRLVVPAAGRVTVSSTAKLGAGKHVLYAKALARAFTRAQTVALTLVATKQARTRLAHLRVAKVALVIVFRPTHGAAQTVRATVTVRG